ncbi:MAG: hypothetical protein ABSE95_15100 [Thermodesulfobacteriota bacterium]|jgi:hypothetical protein
MDTRIKRNQINFKGKMVHIDIDRHKLSWRITALVEGEIVLAVTLAKTSYDSFKRILIERNLGIRRIYLKVEGFGFGWGFLVGWP